MALLNTVVLCRSRLRNTALALLLAFLPGSCFAQAPARAAVPGKEDVLNAIGHKELARDPQLKFGIKPWNAHPGSFVAVVYLTVANDSIGTDEGLEAVRSPRLQPTVALLDYSQGRLILTAKSDGPKGLGEECRAASETAKEATDGSLCKGFDLDLAPYRVTPTETAIGIRTGFHNIYAAGEGDYENLTLLAVTGQVLKPIFSETMSGSFEERGPNEMNTSKATLQVSSHQTGDHADLLLIEHNRTERLIEDSTAGHPGKTLAQRRFVWNGSVYVEAKEASTGSRKPGSTPR